ncbi:MAG TPA: secretin and TonB N-terminal domain-containing protein, partial [Steroidobacteraceae bacterium]|nr:secretin and TonB N-terminal domain-containing protein [Steroidobacteraceae bacterium]
MGTQSTVLRGWPAAVLLIGTVVLGLRPSVAWAEEAPRRFDIPAEQLGAALDEFARQANVTLLFSSTLVAHARTPGVHGALPVAAALGQLLGGTGLGFRQVSASAIAIVGASGRTGTPQAAAAAAAGAAAHSPAEAARPQTAARGMLSRIAG